MSAYGYERTFSNTLNYVRFTPESGLISGLALKSACDPKQTLRGMSFQVFNQAKEYGKDPSG